MPSTASKAAAKKASPALNPEVFGLKVGNHQLLRLAYDAYLAEGRSARASTKTRGQVSGGGKKPWRQKGTGHARVGSSRNPIWRGGGIAFGPRGNQNFTKIISTNTKRLALRQALSLAAADNKLVVLPSEPVGIAKTKDMALFLSKHAAGAAQILLAVKSKTPELERASRNLSYVDLVNARYLNVYKLLNADAVLLTPEALAVIEQWLGRAGGKGQS